MDQYTERRLAAIMFTDIVGYTDLMGKNESEAFELINTQRDLIKPIINSFNGTWIKEVGDGTISSFNSAFEAANCGLEIQRILRHNSNLTIRIGIHIGDIIEKDGDIFGDGVNIASRLESNADPGGICISERVYEDIKNKPEIKTSIIGEKQLKGVELPVVTYKILTEETSTENNNTNADIIGVKNNNLVKALFAFVVIGIFCFYFYYNNIIILNQSNTVNPKSIAVLLFDNFSPNPDDEYLSSGFTEVIIANLAKIKDLLVISRTSIMRYKDSKMGLKEIAKELNVANILEGSIQRNGNKIRVVGQLIEAKTDKHLWAETYDADFEDIFSIQTSIAQEIAASLKLQISEVEKSVIEEKLTDNIEAYETYLKIKEFRQNTFQIVDSQRQLRINLLEKLIDLDPDFAEAYALLSIEHSEMVHFGLDMSHNRKNMALENIEIAFRLKPESPEVRFAYGYYYYGCFKDYLRALEHYQYALTKEPGNANYIAYIGYVHRRLGNGDETIKYLEKAIILDPNDISLLGEFDGTLLFFKKYEKINLIESDREHYRLAPNDGRLYTSRALVTFWMEENTTNARIIINESSKLTPDFDYYKYVLWQFDIYDENYDNYLDYVSNKEDSIFVDYRGIMPKYAELGFAYWLLDETIKQEKAAEKALDMMLKLKEYEGDPRYYSMLGFIYAMLGENDQAVKEAKMAIALSPPSKDVFKAGIFEGVLADVYTVIGEHNKALDMIEKFLTGPSNFSWEDIKYHHVYNKVYKNNPRFKSIVKKDEDRFRKEATYDLSIYLP